LEKRLLAAALLVANTLSETVRHAEIRIGDECVEVIFIIVSDHEIDTQLMIFLTVFYQIDQRLALQDLLSTQIINFVS
jgi:hypothetical protein